MTAPSPKPASSPSQTNPELEKADGKEDDPKSSKEKILAQLSAKLKEAEEATSNAEAARQRAEATEGLEEKAHALEEAAKEDKRAKARCLAASAFDVASSASFNLAES